MMKRLIFGVLLTLSIVGIVYGGFFRTFTVYDNLDKFDQLKNAGIKLKLPGGQTPDGAFKVETDVFTEPEVVNAVTFEGIGLYKDGRLISLYPDLRMLRGRRPCPS